MIFIPSTCADNKRRLGEDATGDRKGAQHLHVRPLQHGPDSGDPHPVYVP